MKEDNILGPIKIYWKINLVIIELKKMKESRVEQQKEPKKTNKNNK